MKHRIFLLGALSLLLLSGCSDPIESKSSMNIDDWFDERYEEELQFSPIELSFLGRKEQNDRLDSMTFESFVEHLEWKAKSVEMLQSLFHYEALTDQQQLSVDVWVYQYEQMLKSKDFFLNGLTFDQMNGLQSFLPTFLINFHQVDSETDLLAYISRIEDVETRVNEALEIAKQSSANGAITPVFALDGVIEQSKAIITGRPFQNDDRDSDIWADFRAEMSALEKANLIDSSRAKEMQINGEKALKEKFMPAYEKIIAWAELEKDKAPEISTGVGGQPNGKAYYEHRLAMQTTTQLTANEIHEIGLAEIKRLRGDMLAIMDEVGFEGSLQDFFQEVRTGEWNYYPDDDSGRQQYIDDATKAIDNIASSLPDYFGLLPKAELVVKRVERFRERDGAAQHYYPGTPDGTRPGTYYAHLSDMTAMPKNQLEVIAYHEGLPGHHMQISIAQELKDIPKFRTQAGFTAYSEGWALYSEALATEIPGTYQDPYNRFGQLTSEIWRAIRLVVDTGLHSKGWTEQEAIDFFMENSPEPLESVVSEIQRYIVMPGQATSYKIGMLKIQELRKRAEESLGEKFSLKTFHDKILGGGALPLPLLEKVIDRWIERTLSG